MRIHPFALALVVATTAAPAAAQAPATPVSAEGAPYARVDAALAIGDTSAALRHLLVLARAGDAEAWYRRGDLLTRRLPMPFLRPASLGPGEIAAGFDWAEAEEALRNATKLAPDSARYWMALARHQLWQRSGITHHDGYVSIDSALGAAHRVVGADAFGVVAYEAAMLFWRQALLLDGRTPESLAEWDRAALARDDSVPPPVVRRYRLARVGGGRLGRRELVQAAELLGLAADSLPSVALLRRRHYAALAMLGAWEELGDLAGRRARAPRGDEVDLLALGLARQRLADAARADSAFAAARRAMPDADRIRLTTILRVLSLVERAGFGIIRPEDRDRIEERAWLLVDPLWRVPGNEIRNEFMARVAHAELRWGTGAAGFGADSDPGAVWIAFGPPAVTQTVWVDTLDVARAGALVSWRWRPTGEVHFELDPGAVDERLPAGRRSEVQLMVDQRGVNWSGVPGVSGLDTIPVQSALFRAGPDSADLFVAARIPTDRLSQGAPATLALDLFIRTNDGELVRHDSTRWVLDAAQRRGPAMRVWRRRLPRASYLHRVEAYEPVEARGARGASMPASLDDVAFRLDGYGVSQVLVTQGVASRTGSTGDRWSDYNILPNPGALHRDGAVSLLWEVYGDSATTLEQYRVTVTLQPPSPAVARTLGLQARTGIVGGASRRVRSRDRVSVTYERRHAAGARVRVEQVDLGAVNVSAGIYVLRVDVVDAASGRTATTSRLVAVR